MIIGGKIKNPVPLMKDDYATIGGEPLSVFSFILVPVVSLFS